MPPWVGPSGCGKSTLLNLIDGLLSPESGKILVQGKPAADSRLHMGYMLQKDHLFEWRTIYRNVVLGLEIQHRLTPENLARGGCYAGNLRVWLLSGIPGLRSCPEVCASGPALIRTLALDPSLLLLDEPFSALDYQTRLQVADDIGQIIRREQKTALLVTHDIGEAISMADRVLVLSPRPARIRRVNPHRAGNPGTGLRSAPGRPRSSKTYFNLIWKELNSHEKD